MSLTTKTRLSDNNFWIQLAIRTNKISSDSE